MDLSSTNGYQPYLQSDPSSCRKEGITMIMHVVSRSSQVPFKIASVCMMRVSEYLPGAEGVDHWLGSDDVAFRLWDNRIVPSWRAFMHKWAEV